MGKRGTKQKPTKLKLIEGNPGKRAINKREPQPNASRPICPPHIMADRQARLIWHRTIRFLDEVGLITQLDRDALACYCQAYSLWIEAIEHLREEGMITVSPRGYPIQSPYLAITNKQMKQMKDFMTEFGMTPSSRTGLHVQSESPEDALKNLIRD